MSRTDSIQLIPNKSKLKSTVESWLQGGSDDSSNNSSAEEEQEKLISRPAR
jgi:hypothetical protein